MSEKILVFTATYNEAKNIEKFIKLIDNLKIKLDLLVVDDNSPDGTSEIIKKIKPDNINLNLISRPKKEGLDTAHKLAFRLSKEKNMIFLLQWMLICPMTQLKFLIFLKMLKKNTFVIGSRYIEGGRSDLKGGRLFMSYFGNKFIKNVFKIDCAEFTSSYRGLI